MTHSIDVPRRASQLEPCRAVLQGLSLASIVITYAEWVSKP